MRYCDFLCLLISRQIHVDLEDSRRMTPLHVAAGCGQESTTKILLNHKADLMFYVSLSSAKNLCYILVLLEPKKVSHNGFTPLMMSVLADSLQCMEELIEASWGLIDDISSKSSLDKSDWIDHKGIQQIKEFIRSAVLKIFIEKKWRFSHLWPGSSLLSNQAGADVNGNISVGVTPLGLSAHGGLTEIIERLLKAGADANIPNIDGLMKPIEIAAVFSKRQDVEILFPSTSPISSVPDWSIDGIITDLKLKVPIQLVCNPESQKKTLRCCPTAPYGQSREKRQREKEEKKTTSISLICIIILQISF
ncbi:serine/threonine-protein phosphatase 6 regulatory ankyrin repeat subunit A-like [Phoenix dactylifera]|uniref:Serine/threonine-protein phosphatase 6 regulatory ankyrin repeat subunit A-like n=1 Tax=Phoenix dactylifera TaxID=42345 RepID=A0A8B8ZR41_PHODC|nr:serine/threonine-protein phosphatase 6 regulatory ankyrin repeat subunit A-like [Phoenix dactylifera]